MGAVQVPIAPLWIKFPAHVPGKAVKDGPNAHMGEQTEAAVTIWGVKQQTQDPCFPLVPPASVYICNSLFQTHTHTHSLKSCLKETALWSSITRVAVSQTFGSSLLPFREH